MLRSIPSPPGWRLVESLSRSLAPPIDAPEPSWILALLLDERPLPSLPELQGQVHRPIVVAIIRHQGRLACDELGYRWGLLLVVLGEGRGCSHELLLLWWLLLLGRLLLLLMMNWSYGRRRRSLSSKITNGKPNYLFI